MYPQLSVGWHSPRILLKYWSINSTVHWLFHSYLLSAHRNTMRNISSGKKTLVLIQKHNPDFRETHQHNLKTKLWVMWNVPTGYIWLGIYQKLQVKVAENRQVFSYQTQVKRVEWGKFTYVTYGHLVGMYKWIIDASVTKCFSGTKPSLFVVISPSHVWECESIMYIRTSMHKKHWTVTLR